MTRINFFVEGVKRLKTTGTITRSSRFVIKEMLNHVDFTNATCIVELGAGDGVITKHILKQMAPNAKLLAFEVIDIFCEEMRLIKDSRLQVVEDSAEKIGHYLAEQQVEYADFIVSAIPFVALPDDLGNRILEEAGRCLKPGGKFIQLNYSLLAKKRYEKVFDKIDVHFVPINIPPAFVLVCNKK